MDGVTIHLPGSPASLMASADLLPGRDASDDRRLFEQALSKAGAGPDASPEGRAREAAEQLVSAALVSPVLKMLRESTGAAEPFAPSTGERTFRQMQDTMIAQRMVKAAHWPLIDTLARRMLERFRPAGVPATGSTP